MDAEEQSELAAIDRDFAEHGCAGVGEYSRCADMSDRFAELLAEVDALRAAASKAS